jgi:hypothetical protein
MKAWLKIACLGLAVGAYAAGCTITSDDDDEGIGGANTSGGSKNTGGTESDTGGMANSGGAAGADNTGGTGNTEPSACEVCLADKCADELDACDTTEDSDNNNQSDCYQEYAAFQTCVEDFAVNDDLGYFDLTSDDVEVRVYCSSEAALFDPVTAIPLTPTNALIACTAPDEVPPEGDCFVECLDFLPAAGGAGGS